MSAPDAFFASGPPRSPAPEPNGSTTRWVCITDLHGRRDALANIPDRAGRCDMVLLGGDITHMVVGGGVVSGAPVTSADGFGDLPDNGLFT